MIVTHARPHTRHRRPRRPATRRRGLTLVEVIVAVALLVATVGVMMRFFNDLLAARTTIIEHTAQQRATNLLIDRLEADLLTCLAGDATLGPGVRGDEHSIEILSRSVAPYLARGSASDRDNAMDNAAFDERDDETDADAGATGPDAALTDVQFSSYRFDRAEQTIWAARGLASQRAAASSEGESLGGRIARIRFRYHDGQGWQSSFNSVQAGRLPRAVEIAVWYDPWPADLLDDMLAVDDESDPMADMFERETFDTQPTFDEQTYARLSDLDLEEEPMPDRRRVIAILDADAADTTDTTAPPEPMP